MEDLTEEPYQTELVGKDSVSWEKRHEEGILERDRKSKHNQSDYAEMTWNNSLKLFKCSVYWNSHPH